MSTAIDLATETLLEKAKRCFKRAVDGDSNQREREREDLRFQVPENQWTDTAKEERKGGYIGNVAVPARPMLSISLLHQPMQLVQNQAASAKPGVSIHPVSEDAEKELAEIKQGLYRRIERDSNADQARLWALDRAKQCGRGWYRVNTQWDEDGDDEFDQEIVIERILHQETVYMDPSSQKPDYSDAEYGFVVAWKTLETFKREFPSFDLEQYGGGDGFFEATSEQSPDWVKNKDGSKSVLVAEYFYKVHDYEEISRGGRKRTKDRVTVKWCKLTGLAILEEEDWNGHYIPLIPVIGRELQPFDGERRWEGMTRPARHAQMFFNYAASNMVERMGLEPKAPYVMVEGQQEGHEQEWAQANRRNFPYLLYKGTSIGDKPAPPPQRSQIDASGVSLGLMAMQEGKSLMQSATAIYDPSLGRETARDKSGKAILALQQQADAGTSHYVQGMATISMPYEARVVLDLMPAIYDRPGRVTYVLGGEDEPEAVMLGKPYVTDPRNGRPMAVPPKQPGAKFYDLNQGKYRISVSIGKSFQTRLQQGQEELGELIPNLPPEAQVLLLPTYLRFRDTPGAEEAAKLMKKFRDMKFPGLEDEEGQQPTPEQAQAKLQALEQQVQQMQAALQEAAKFVETDQAKQQASIVKTKMDNEAKVAIAAMKQQTDAKEDALKVQMERMEQAFEAQQNELDRRLEIFLAQFKAAHETALAAAQGQSVEFSQDRGQEQGRESENERSQGASRGTESSQESGTEQEAGE